jgi:hypothetical protein
VGKNDGRGGFTSPWAEAGAKMRVDVPRGRSTSSVGDGLHIAGSAAIVATAMGAGLLAVAAAGSGGAGWRGGAAGALRIRSRGSFAGIAWRGTAGEPISSRGST